MADGWKALKITQFERVEAGPETALLRISATAAGRRGAPPRPMLRIGHEQEIHRFAPIPAPPDPRGLLRAAYSVAPALLGSHTRFWLEHGDGGLTELPPPARAEPELEPTRAQLVALQGQLAELEIWRGELERRLAATTTELGESARVRAAQAREIEQMAAELALLRARHDPSGGVPQTG